MARYAWRTMLAAFAIAAIAALTAAAGGADEVKGTTCASSTGTATLSPGAEATAKVQNVSAKGVLTGCVGSTGESGD